jgi:predicted 3-demethylubiquinone-9 3-methyltransferase (glyoxalase superfamily)
MSLQVMCATQEEVDYYWAKLTAGDEPQPCGWLKDRYGLSWQVIPNGMDDLLSDGSPGAERAMEAMLQMQKLDIVALRRAHAGAS